MAEPLDRLKAALAGRYQIEREIGRGGMASVYLAQDLKHARPVALKVLHPDLAATLGTERFLREIRIAAQLNHPHILTLIDSGEVQGFLYYVMPHVSGESLRQKLDRDKELSLDEALGITQQVAGALEYAHRHKVIHRDIKPENVLFHEGEAMVADFGIALAVTAAGGERLTETGLSLGTPEYMSPEQSSGGRELDGRSDIYSLACVLYEMLAGEPPYTGPTAQAVIAKRFSDPVPSVHRLREVVPTHLDGALMKALAKMPPDRFPTAKHFAEALARPGPIAVEPQVKSIVVLPFANISPDPDTEYFSDGLTEEITTDLSKVHALRVISRTSAMKLKGSQKDVPAIARQLKVQYVVEGSVRRAGNSLRVTAQLIDAANDAHLWAEKYSGTLEDVFEIQEKLSRTIVAALKLKLSPEEDGRIAVRPIGNLRAYECYLRARQEIYQFTPEALDRALQLVRNGLQIGGDNALLHATAGYVHWQYVNLGMEYEANLRRASDCLDRVLQLEPDSSHAHVLAGLIYNKRGSQQEAVRSLKRALVIDPNNPDALYWLIYVYGVSGKGVAARPLAKKLLEVDPLTAANHLASGCIDFFEGRFEAALYPFQKCYEMDPEGPVARWAYALILAWNDRLEEAYSLLDLLAEQAPKHLFAHQGMLFKFALQRNRSRTLECLSPELRDGARGDEQLSWQMAGCYALIGEKEQALDWLENAVQRGFISYQLLSERDPFLQNLRGEPRFAQLMEQVKQKWEAFEV